MGGDLHYDWGQAAASALDWWVEAGVDTLVDDDPRDWLAKIQRHATTPAADETSAPALPDTLEEYLAWRFGSDAPEAGWHSPLLAPMGAAGAPLMVLLDMPEAGDTETLLSGPEGRLLDRMLAAIGQRRDEIYLATIAIARPFSGTIGRDVEPRLFELARHLVGLVAPQRLLLLGNCALRAFAAPEDGSTLGGLRDINHGSGSVKAFASLHPRLLLERPARKAEAWRHLQLLIGESL